MTRIDRRINYLIGFDTETCNGLMVDDKLDLSQSLVYDIGWAVCDKKGKIYKTESFVIAEIFCGMKDVMKSAYYSEKIPQYWEDIKSGKRKLVSFWTMKKAFMKDVKDFKVKNIFAHNAGFDVRALNNTIRYITKSKYRWFLPFRLEVWDTLKMAHQTIGQQKSYIRYCIKNDYMTKHKKPRPRLTAEILFRYLSGNESFIESHTGLEDVLIESQILAHCLRQHKKVEKRLFVKN